MVLRDFHIQRDTVDWNRRHIVRINNSMLPADDSRYALWLHHVTARRASLGLGSSPWISCRAIDELSRRFQGKWRGSRSRRACHPWKFVNGGLTDAKLERSHSAGIVPNFRTPRNCRHDWVRRGGNMKVKVE